MEQSRVQKILVVQTAFIGDNILATPVIRSLHAIYPDAELSVLTTVASADIYRYNPIIRHVITFDKRREERGVRGVIKKALELRKHRFDAVYSLHRSARTSFLLFFAGIPVRIGFAESRCAFLYTKTVPKGHQNHAVLRNLSLLTGDAERGVISEELDVALPEKRRDRSTGKYVVLFPESAWKTKRWNLEGFREVAEELASRGLTVRVLGTDSQYLESFSTDNPKIINLAGKTNLVETMELVASASLVVCNDSMALHLASAFKVPVVTIFCATSPEFGFGPWKTNARIVQRESLRCKPCRRHGGNYCPTGTEACIKEVSSSRVLDAVAELLEC